MRVSMGERVIDSLSIFVSLWVWTAPSSPQVCNTTDDAALHMDAVLVGNNRGRYSHSKNREDCSSHRA